MKSASHLLARILALALVLGATGVVPVLVELSEGQEEAEGCSSCSPACHCPCCPVRLAEQVRPAGEAPALPPRPIAFAQLVFRLPAGVRSDVFHPPSA